jgi:hypothetical protein
MKLQALVTLIAVVGWVGTASAVHINTSGRCPFGQACDVGDANATSITLNTDGATLGVDVTANAATLTAATTGTATFLGADAAGAANTALDTTGAGTVTVGSADVTAVILSADADVQIQGGATGNVDLTFHDYADSADDDMAHGLIRVNCTTATTTAEDCDLSLGVVEAGAAAQVRMLIDADGGFDIGSANTNDVTFTTDGAALDLDGTANALTLTATTTATATFVGADAAGAANTALDTTGAGAITIGSADVTAVTVTTDGAGDAEVVLSENSIGGDEAGSIMAETLFFCGESCNNSTCAGGHSVAFLSGDYSASHALAAAACDTLGETSIAAASEIASANNAFKVHGMYCVTDSSGSNGVTLAMTAADAALTPAVTCTIATGETTCASTTSSTTDVAAGAVVAVSIVTTENLSANDIDRWRLGGRRCG